MIATTGIRRFFPASCMPSFDQKRNDTHTQQNTDLSDAKQRREREKAKALDHRMPFFFTYVTKPPHQDGQNPDHARQQTDHTDSSDCRCFNQSRPGCIGTVHAHNCAQDKYRSQIKREQRKQHMAQTVSPAYTSSERENRKKHGPFGE